MITSRNYFEFKVSKMLIYNDNDNLLSLYVQSMKPCGNGRTIVLFLPWLFIKNENKFKFVKPLDVGWLYSKTATS